jgi:hypothetical protein
MVPEIRPGAFESSGGGTDLLVHGFEDYPRIEHVMYGIESQVPNMLPVPHRQFVAQAVVAERVTGLSLNAPRG